MLGIFVYEKTDVYHSETMALVHRVYLSLNRMNIE